ncbi:MAG TPA: CheR family methyltransferase [Nitrospiraceae bacterium]|nr:CheR family methyltransferase [Nitrospiraceae bacterium]
MGIGSSAGGIEALEEFFRHLPANPGAAFVVVSHQHAGHSSLLPEILRRWTALPVFEASDGLPVEPNTIYLPPPGSRLAILHAVLHVMDGGDGVRPLLPIDYFLCSLAEDQQEKAVGIILSGTGTDGSVGLKAIRAESGMTMAQEPRSAKFAGMPQNAITLGVVDMIRPPAELGVQLSNFVQHRTVLQPGQVVDGDGKRDLNKILVYLRDRIGNDFSLYKSNTTLRRIERRMNLHQIATLPHYAQFLQSDPIEVHALFSDLLIGVTSFFRDPSAYDILMQVGLPQLLDKKPDGATVRIWVPACSTGEEAYTLAMLLQEFRSQQKRKFTIQMFATDIDGEAIDKARHGLYPEGIANQISPERLKSFFVKEDSHYRVKSELRDCVTFATHNLLKDAPFIKLDLLSCRNFLIYVRPETQHGLIPLFHYALKPMGLLMLGAAETVDGFTNLFTALDRKARIFTRDVGPASLPIREMRLAPTGDHVTPESIPGRHRVPLLVESIQTYLLDRFVPSAVFVNRQGQVVYIQGRTGDYLEPGPGAANHQVTDMVRPELRPDLLAALQLAHKQGGTVVRKGVRLQTPGSVRRVTFTVTPLSQPGPLDGLMLVVFDTESARAVKLSTTLRKVRPLSKGRGRSLELEYAQQRLHRTNTDLQVSNEEFKSSNEELQSTNEELQSTNEELETTKEELQSLNEELITVNAQLQNKFEEAANANDDLRNLVNSSEVATIFLDGELCIKRFTPGASRVSKVIATDIGRPFGDIVSTVRYDGLLDDARTVLQTLVFTEREVQAEGGNWYLLRMVPYRTSKNLIDGVVLTYLDITAYKQATHRAESIVDGVPTPLIVLDTDLRVVMANRAFYQVFARERREVERHPLDRILEGRFNHPALRTAVEKRFIDATGVDSIELELESLPVGDGRWRASINRLIPAGDEAPLMLLALQHGPNTR